jgi:PAS domain S-box-containing protein
MAKSKMARRTKKPAPKKAGSIASLRARLRRTEERLRDQVSLTEAIVRQIPNAVFAKDTEGRFTMVNRGWCEMSGKTAEEALGRTANDLYPPELAQRIAREDASLLAQGASAPLFEAVHQGPRPNQWRIVRKAVLSREDGTVVGLISSSTDISDLKRVEGELADRAKFVGELIDALPVSIALRDTEGRFLQVNRTWERYFNICREEAIGRRFPELPGWREGEELEAAAKRSIQLDLEAVARGPTAEPVAGEGHRLGRSYVVSRQVFTDSTGRTTAVLATGVDITENKAMETALKQAEREAADRAKFISEMVEALPISVAMRDLEGRYVLVNRAWERYFGIRREDVLGRRRRELPGADGDPLRAEDVARIEAADRDLLARPDFVPEPRELQRQGRSYLISSRALADSSGRLIGILSAGVETTEREAMMQALAAERHRLALVVNATQAGIIDWDTGTEEPWYSDRFKEMLGYPPSADTSAWASIFGALMHPDDRDRSREVFLHGLVSRGEPNSVAVQEPLDLRLRRADGSWLWVQSMGLTLRDEAGEAKRYLAAITDITERRAQEEELRESVRLREEVERMSRHDLKTPLNSVIAMSRLLREGGRVTPEDAELLGTIERAGYRILNMVNLSLDLFRMETGTYQFHPQAVDLAAVACRVAADLESQAASKGIDVRVRANGVSAATQEVLVRGDELLCYSMFANLLKNAIEASPPGGTVSVSLKRDDASVIAEVHNPGTVPESMRKRFFRKYATTGKSAGLGLGTYSARLMARVQEGDLALESSEASGTTLVARLKPAGAELPRAVESLAAARASGAAAAALPPRKVLVVDDDEFNRLVLRRYLPSPPLSVAFAVNGRAALDAAERDWPDVVLLDLEMPVMDGYVAAQALRDMERARGLKRCLIVAISSNDEEHVVQRALAAGCDQYVVKPAPRQVLWRILGALGSESAPVAAAAGAMDSGTVRVDEGLKAVLPEFLRSRRELLGQMPAALAAGDRVQFRRYAHRLAGSFALYGFAWAAAQCRAIEDDALAGEPQDLEQRAAAVRAHLDTVTIEYASAGEPFPQAPRA